MWWGKEDPEMYYPDGRPANDSARRAAGYRTCSPCVSAAKSYSSRPSVAARTLHPIDFFEGIDLTRSSFAAKTYYGSVDTPTQLAEGVCLVCTLPEDSFRAAAVSTGHPDELFVGFKLGRASDDGSYGPSVTVGGGYFRIYTLMYDKTAI